MLSLAVIVQHTDSCAQNKLKKAGYKQQRRFGAVAVATLLVLLGNMAGWVSFGRLPRWIDSKIACDVGSCD